METPRPATPSYLFIQTGDSCTIERKESSGNITYSLSSVLKNDTIRFTDRPVVSADTLPTEAFVQEFGSLFNESSPNVGLTFVSDESDGSEGEIQPPLVVIASDPHFNDTTGMVVYDIEQSANQTAVASLDGLFAGSITAMTVSYNSCSLFIDSASSIRCGVCQAVVGTLFTAGSQAICDAECVGLVALTCPGSFFNPICDVIAATCVPMCLAIFAAGGPVTASGVCEHVSLC